MEGDPFDVGRFFTRRKESPGSPFSQLPISMITNACSLSPFFSIRSWMDAQAARNHKSQGDGLHG